MTPFNTLQGDRPVQVTAMFAQVTDIEELYLLNQDFAGGTEAQKLASHVLDSLLAEIKEYEDRHCFADNEKQLCELFNKGCSESGMALVFKVGGRIVSAAFLHVTWKGNLFLDWMTTMPAEMDRRHKIKELGMYMLGTVLVVARQLFDANLVFIESKKGIAADFYKKVLDLKEKCDFILLVRDRHDQKIGWKVSEHIYGFADGHK